MLVVVEILRRSAAQNDISRVLTRLIFQNNYMRFVGQTAARHLQGRLGIDLRKTHLFEKFAECVEWKFRSGG